MGPGAAARGTRARALRAAYRPPRVAGTSVNRGAGERAGSCPSSQLNFGRQRKTGAEARQRRDEGTNAAQELLKASTRSRRREAATPSAAGDIRDRQHRWAVMANASGPSAAGNYKASSSPARGRWAPRRARRRTACG